MTDIDHEWAARFSELLNYQGKPHHELARAYLDMRARNERLREALGNVMVGGNHLALVLTLNLTFDWARELPPHTDPEVALERLGATGFHDIWVCWALIMRARQAYEESGR